MTERALDTPLRIEKSPSGTYSVFDASNSVVAFHLTKKEAEEIILRCNVYEGLVETLAKLTTQYEMIYNHCDDGWGSSEDYELIEAAHKILAKAEDVGW